MSIIALNHALNEALTHCTSLYLLTKQFSAAHRKSKTASIGTGLRQEPDSDRARSVEYLYWEATFHATLPGHQPGFVSGRR